MSEEFLDHYIKLLEQRGKRRIDNPPCNVDGFYECQCCGLPTITNLSAFEICEVCWWEDDGQDDVDAEIVCGGPNGRYSLTHARQNFRKHLHMYDLDDEVLEELVELVKPDQGRLRLLDIVRASLHEPEQFDTKAFRDWKSKYSESSAT